MTVTSKPCENSFFLDLKVYLKKIKTFKEIASTFFFFIFLFRCLKNYLINNSMYLIFNFLIFLKIEEINILIFIFYYYFYYYHK